MKKTIVPDTSAIIDGLISKLIEEKKIKEAEIIIHNAVLAELEHQANFGKEIGFLGLEELQKLNDIPKKNKKIKIVFVGERPNESQMKRAKSGEIDALIRQIALEKNALFITLDRVDAEAAKAQGIEVLFIETEKTTKPLSFEKYLDSETMSLHIREGMGITAKKGVPGNWKIVKVSTKVLEREEVESIAREIVDEGKMRIEDSFIEIERRGSIVAQIRDYRIVITKPPFADGWEITIVRPIAKLKMSDYKLPPEIQRLFETKADGIIIAGAPGNGKCLPGSEIVYAGDGMPHRIKDVYNSDISDIYSVNEDGLVVKNKIIQKSKRIDDTLYQITTRTGRSITSTKEHPILSFADGKISWVEAQKLDKGSKIALLRSFNGEEDDYFDVLKYYPGEKTLCYMSSELEIELPICYKFRGTKRKIVELLEKAEHCTLKEIIKYCNRSGSVVRSYLSELCRDGAITRKKRGVYEAGTKMFKLTKDTPIFLNDARHLGLTKYIERIAAITNTNRTIIINVPKKATTELCKFLGYYASEGGGGKISFSNNDETLMNEFKASAKASFGISDWKKCGKTLYIDCNESFRPLFDSWGLCLTHKQKSRYMSLPDFLFKCSKNNLKEFLAAYFDSDGYVGKEALHIYTSSKSAAKQLTRLLLRLGIVAKLSSKFYNGWNRYDLEVRDCKSIRRFWKGIGMQCKLKKEKIQALALSKEHTQTFTYDIESLLKESVPDYGGINAIDKKFSLERMECLLEDMYNFYFRFTSKNENLLQVFRAYLDMLHEARKRFDSEKDKLTCDFFREHNMDRACQKAWKNGRKIRLSTMIKILNALGHETIISSKSLANMMACILSSSKISITDISSDVGINTCTLKARMTQGWEQDTDCLENVYNAVSTRFSEKKCGLRSAIKTLELLCKSDLIFDDVKDITIKKGTFEVFDFETENHNFVCGEIPLIVHNSTFAQALAETYLEKGKVVKTVEAPRDLRLPPEITQYSKTLGTLDEIRDVLLLSRPDYTIFDEMRNNPDFALYADLRLAGVGMVGIVHASTPIDAIQRFVKRVELGVIPSIVDTVIFIQNGGVGKVYSLVMSVKVPAGMTESDLSRPVIEIKDYFSKETEYEMYTFGDQTVTMPVSHNIRGIEGKIKKMIPYPIEVEIKQGVAIVYVEKRHARKIIGKRGDNIRQIEKKVGMPIEINPY